ncbi:hypothetical protein CEP54_006015 [Fusarium duplospermum]|uniref:Uncharacterized protein n=1 Tax=Fusarium duplospermum TaxID=1325734 RepID=A0A428Q9I9_9HYPO|nr:hypothetical protein CEP54_006015 [Fusarium duplospermum]
MAETSPFDLAREDPAVAASRVLKVTIRKGGDLTRTEKISLIIDLFEVYAGMPGLDSKLSVSELYNEFFNDMFKHWTSGNGANQTPVLPSREREQFRTKVEAPYESLGTKRSHSQMLDKPVFLVMKFDPEEETISWVWQDENKKVIKLKDLESRLPKGVTMNDAKAWAIQHYDSVERERITKYNRDLVIRAARRRIYNWARPESSHRFSRDPERVTKKDLIHLVLARDVHRKLTQNDNEVDAIIDRELDDQST